MNTPAPVPQTPSASGTGDSTGGTSPIAPEPDQASAGSGDFPDGCGQEASGDTRDDEDDEYEPLV
jgi:hypothetical protein